MWGEAGLRYSNRGREEPWDVIPRAKVHVLDWPSIQLPGFLR